MSDTSSAKQQWIESFLNKDNPTEFPFEYTDLIPEYFNKRMKYYLNQKKAMMGAIYVEKNAFQNFKREEINKTNNDLNPNHLREDAL